jgi:hypothetical protein
MALLLSINAARAQGPESLPPPAGRMMAVAPPSSFPPSGVEGMSHSVDQPMHREEHEEHAEGGECGHEEERGLFVTADFLYVRPRRRALDFAISDPVADGASVRGKVESLDWENNGAYRIGAGYRLDHGWEVGGTYFYLHSKDNRSLTAGPGGALFATLTAPGIDQVNTANGSTNVDMDIIDLDLAKRIHVCDNLIVRVAAGGRIASIQQKLFAAYTGGTAGAGAIVSSPISFDGIGLKAGSEAWFKVWRGVGVYAKANASLLTGNFRTRLGQSINGGGTGLIDVTDKFTKVVPITEMGLGLAWQSDNIRVSVGYEIANFFNMVDSVDFVDGQSFGKIQHRQSDLSYDGVAVSVGLFF